MPSEFILPTGTDPSIGGAPASASGITDREAAVPPERAQGKTYYDMGGSAASPTEGPRVKKDREAAVPPGDDLPQRKRPAHLPNIERHNQPIILFVTICSNDRREILTSERVHSALVRLWSQARQYHVGRYILMPDHLHLFCSPASLEAENVKGWVAYWKRLASIELKELSPLWQRECWDTQLRDVGHYGDKWEYVVRNPVRKGLVSRSEDWPYQGCLNELRW